MLEEERGNEEGEEEIVCKKRETRLKQLSRSCIRVKGYFGNLEWSGFFEFEILWVFFLLLCCVRGMIVDYYLFETNVFFIRFLWFLFQFVGRELCR